MSSTRRRLLKPKKNCGEVSRLVTEPPQRFEYNKPVKRKHDDDSERERQLPSKKIHSGNQENKSKVTRSFRNESDSFTPNSRIPKIASVGKYSANDRLKKYRKSLGERTESVVKVHRAVNNFESNDSTAPKNNEGVVNRLKLIKSKECDNCVSSGSSPLVRERLLEAKNSCNSQTTSKITSNDDSQFASATDNNDGNSCVNQLVKENSDVDMEWSPIEVNEVVTDIQKLRQEKALLQANKEQSTSSKSENNENIYVVVDTNVFISHLNTIKDLMNLNPYASKYPVIIVPWMVVQELDFFKDGRSDSDTMRNSARRAVKFINDNLTSKNRRLRGQTVQDALKQETRSSNPDDGILFCCMQKAEEAKPTVLLSNDVNLRNKALIHDIPSHGTADVIAEIKKLLFGYDSEENKGAQIISVFTRLCSHIVENEVKLAYGTVAKNLVSAPPWSLKQCLIYMKRFWSSVFSLVIPQKQFVKVLDDMMYFHTSRKEISSDEDVEQFTKLCLSMCVYFKNCLVKYKDQIQNCITSIKDIVN